MKEKNGYNYAWNKFVIISSLGVKMKQSISIFLIQLLLVTYSFAQSSEIADKYWEKAHILYKKNKYLFAAQMFEKSADAERKSPKPRLYVLSSQSGWIGICYEQLGQYEKAIKYYQKALDIGRKLVKKAQIAVYLNKIGKAYKSLGQTNKAIEYLKQALEFHKKLKQDSNIASNHTDIARIYQTLGTYDEAIKHYQLANRTNKKLGKEHYVTVNLSNIGRVYYIWSQYHKAIDYYQRALVINKKLRKEHSIAIQFNNIGLV
ncbi:MAG: tetratricopeptide repeat protein, partial [Deltaproteobacteria bacterium]|nr:tetratricopeptide repeat protein [Deltaproteobacteria bacterium]